jgi:acetyl-CoA carboxylase carboxyl transferase subunit alpha
MNAMERVRAARANERPTAASYINNIFDEFTELHGDRRFSDDKAIIGGIGLLYDMPVSVIGIEKGVGTNDKIYRSFGSPYPEGYRKALRLFKQAEKFRRPVVCFIDTSGANCGIEAEERGQGQAIAENISELMTLKTPVISILIGEGGSGGALALGVADRVWMLENAVYSVISPEGCASILWKDQSKTALAAEKLRLTAEDMLGFNVIEKIISEKGKFQEEIYENIKAELKLEFSALSSDIDALLENRYARFRKIGSSNI